VAAPLSFWQVASSLKSRRFRAGGQWLAAASVVDIPVAPWEDLMTLTILDLYETEKAAHLEAPTVQREVPRMGQREF
jgi:hypothetical protein